MSVRGLMLDGKRKSIEPMAVRLADGDEQCLQQFVNQSPWDPVAVPRALSKRMSREISPEAWVIDDTGFAKFGKMSVGVARHDHGPHLAPIRQRIESIFWTCKNILTLERHGARTLQGLRERVLQRFCCPAAAITRNHQLGRPSPALVNSCA